jgi:hypothetical protein
MHETWPVCKAHLMDVTVKLMEDEAQIIITAGLQRFSSLHFEQNY